MGMKDEYEITEVETRRIFSVTRKRDGKVYTATRHHEIVPGIEYTTIKEEKQRQEVDRLVLMERDDVREAIWEYINETVHSDA